MENNRSMHFIKNVIGWQRQEDHSEFIFNWMLEIYADAEICIQDATQILLEKKVVQSFEELFDQIYTIEQGGSDDIRVSNYQDKKKEAKIKSQELVVSQKVGQLELVGKRGGYREGAGRKKMNKEFRSLKIPLDAETWIVLETIRDLSDKKTSMALVVADLIEKGLDARKDDV